MATTPVTPTRVVALPSATTQTQPEPYYQPSEHRGRLLLKLRERFGAAFSSAAAYGHSFRVVNALVMDIEDKSDRKFPCEICNGELHVRMGEYADPPFGGIVLAFACKKLARN